MKRQTEKALKKMAANGFPDVREALDEIARLRDLLLRAVVGLEDCGHVFGATDCDTCMLVKEANEVLGRVP